MNFKAFRSLGYLSILTVCFSSCGKEVEPTISSSDTDYASWNPIALGYWQEYKVDTFKFIKSPNDTGVTQSQSTIYFHEEITDTLNDFDTPYQFKLRIDSRKNTTDNWGFFRNISIQNTANTFQRNEDNIRKIKMQFPISKSMNWKGNKYVDSSLIGTDSDWNFAYTNIYQTISVNGINFDSTVTVVQYADSNAIEKTYFYEIHAKRIGLIYAEYQKLEKQNGANPWTLPENGYIIRRSIVDWKK